MPTDPREQIVLAVLCALAMLGGQFLPELLQGGW